MTHEMKVIQAIRAHDARALARLLSEAGAEKNPFDEGEALRQAATIGRADMVEALLRSGRDPNASGGPQFTALHIACHHGHLGCVTTLLAHGARHQAGGAGERFPLHWAADFGRSHLIQALIASGADVNAKEDRQLTSLQIAAGRPWGADTLTALVSAGAVIEARGGPHRGTELWIAADNGLTDCAETLLRLGADPNATSEQGHSALMRALAGFHFEVADLLLDHGAAIDQVNAHGLSALQIASFQENLESLRLLVRRGANLEGPGRPGEPTPLEIAAAEDNPLAVAALLDAGCRPSLSVDKRYKSLLGGRDAVVMAYPDKCVAMVRAKAEKAALSAAILARRSKPSLGPRL